MVDIHDADLARRIQLMRSVISCDVDDLTAKGRRELANRDDLGDLLEGFGIRLVPFGGRERWAG